MSSADISRLLVQPSKHYVGARMQQGRVVIDSDFNEHAELADEDRRRLVLDVVGPTGSPDQGFAPDLKAGDAVTIQSVSFNGQSAVPVLNYRLRPGTIYLAGLRFEHSERVLEGVSSGDPVAFQRDFLQMRAEDAPQASEAGQHTVMAYLHAWVQTVSATEDEEIRERALGGVDTSVRVRRNARIEFRDVTGAADCSEAWTGIRQQLEADLGGVFDQTGVELVSSARLKISLLAGESLDLCAPCATDQSGRYLGADNQAVRVMLAAPNRYVWAVDNAAPIYRVRVDEPEDGFARVQMLTPPRDEAHWPVTNTVVELLPWSCLLENQQTVAGQVGTFMRVAQGFDPDLGSFAVADTDLASLDELIREWDASHPDLPWLDNPENPEGSFLYMTVWHRLDDEADQVLLDTAAGPTNHTLLRRIGILPEFAGGGKPGDFWVAAVRPNTPQVVVPWNLTQTGGVVPHGTRHFYAPVSMITFRPPAAGEQENTEIVESIVDCRPTFRPLVERGGCCTFTVGDGNSSHGDFTSIQAAIEALTPEGGKVCVLPGVYSEHVVIEKDGVVVEGCGDRARLVSSEQTGSALIHVLGSNVTIRELGFETRGEIGVLAGKESPSAGIVVADLTLDRLNIVAGERAGKGGNTRTAIDIRRARRVSITGCEIEMQGSVSDEAGMFVRGEDIRAEGCRIDTAPTVDSYAAWGGIQVGGSSSRIQIRRNLITGGVGHGVTLGSLEWVTESSSPGLVSDPSGVKVVSLGAGTGIQNAFDPCAPLQPQARPVEVDRVRYDPETAGDLDDVLILDNKIESMRGNGISVLTTLPLNDDGDQDMITVDKLTIEQNRILRCVVQSASLASNSPVPKTTKLSPGEEEVFGQFLVANIPPAGIALVDGEHVTIRNNEIRDNGTDSPEPVSGVCIMFGNDIVLDGNRIQNNGKREPASIASISSSSAGIAVSLAGIASADAPKEADAIGTSLRVTGNIVEHPNGPALAARATGPMVVDDNYLLSLGNNATAQKAGTAHVVALVDVGLPWEAIDLPPNEPSIQRWHFPPNTPQYLQRKPGTGSVGGVGAPGEGGGIVGFGGTVLFNNNHVTLRWVEAANAAAGLASGFAVGVCSLDDVRIHGNQFALNVEDPGIKKKKDGTFNRQPRITSQVVAVGATATATSNRVAEGVNDALISLLVLGGFLVNSSYNLTTHMSFSSTCHDHRADQSDNPDQYRVHHGNLVWLRPVALTSPNDMVSVETVNKVAEQLFETLCDTCLGIGDKPGGGFNLPILGLLFNPNA